MKIKIYDILLSEIYLLSYFFKQDPIGYINYKIYILIFYEVKKYKIKII